MKKLQIIIVRKVGGNSYKVVSKANYLNKDNSKFILENTKKPLIPSLTEHFESEGLETLSVVEDTKTETTLITFIKKII